MIPLPQLPRILAETLYSLYVSILVAFLRFFEKGLVKCVPNVSLTTAAFLILPRIHTHNE